MKNLKQEQEHAIVLRLEELMTVTGPEFVHELIESFFEVGHKNLVDIKLAVESSSQELLVSSARKLRALSFNIGAFDLGKMSQLIEAERDKVAQREILLRIEAQFTKTENFLRGFVNENHSSAS